jgi:hypothetical protein
MVIPWRPLTAAIFYAGLGPLVGAAVIALIFAPAVANLGPLEGGVAAEFLFRAYLVGAPPMIATGFLAGLSSRKRRLPTLTLQSAVLGFIFTGLSMLLLTSLAPAPTEPNTGFILWVATAGAFGGFGAALLTALIMVLRRPIAD